MSKKDLIYVACFLTALASGCAKDNSSLEKKVNEQPKEPAVYVSTMPVKTAITPEKTEKKKQTAIKKAPYTKKKLPEIKKEEKPAPAYMETKIEEKKPIEETPISPEVSISTKTLEFLGEVETDYEVKKDTYAVIEMGMEREQKVQEEKKMYTKKEPRKKQERYHPVYAKRETQEQYSNSLIDELKGYSMVEVKEGTIILHHPYFIDKANLPSFRIEGEIVKSVNWGHVYSDMTIEEFKGHIESVEREQSRMKKSLEKLKEEWRGW